MSQDNKSTPDITKSTESMDNKENPASTTEPLDNSKTATPPQDNPEKTASGESATEDPGKTAATEETQDAGGEEFDFTQFLPDKMEDIAALQIFQLQQWAHIYMGLLTHPKQKKIVKDHNQARIAIDCASAMTESLMPYLPAERQREFKVLISDLKMNFISHSSQEK